ncbi:F-box domain-containing protein [Colletotrichum truncatum]|uniref:F-box domain-containing protein n=1 Tax=Colletotrichum truncatum TaxID=5467 RepID=A0ACC3ZGL8_COLTU|nr:F-box domain-containing protein [Colletotrichum truncatum]KAF6790423.1 F-box domain-containing protein [Colletotrichum truncatum]
MSQHTPPPTKPSLPTMVASTNSQTASPFNKVPLEVLLRISSHLTTPELGSLRLTCRSIEKSLFNTFMKEFFTKRQFMLTEFSLQALVDISKSRLSDCLDHVIIGLNYFDETFFPHDKPARQNAYADALADQRSFVASGQDVAMLTEAFQNLKSLKTVGIRDYNSRERAKRDGNGASWASYGATTIFKETGVDLLRSTAGFSPALQDYINKVMITLFTALGNAGARPKVFEMLRRQQRVPNDNAFNLFTKYLKPKVVPVLEGIETLILVANVGGGPMRATSVPGKPTERDAGRFDYLLRQFLGYLPNVKHIRINFFNPGPNSDQLLEWLASPVPKDPLTPPADTALLAPPPPAAFPHLEELNLGFCDMGPKRLVQIIRKFATTLKKLELYRVTLVNQTGNNQGGYNQQGDGQHKVNMWAKMLKSMREIPGLDLEHIKIGLPSQRCGPAYGRNLHVWFHEKDGPTDEKLTMQEYTGIDWKHYVEELAARVKVEELPAPRYTGDGGGDDDDEEDTDLDEEMMDEDEEEDEDGEDDE